MTEGGAWQMCIVERCFWDLSLAPLGRRWQARHPPRRNDNVPGASLAIIQNGEIVATYGYGVAQPNRPVTPRTRFQAASISKTFNALAVLKLVEASEFRLD